MNKNTRFILTSMGYAMLITMVDAVFFGIAHAFNYFFGSDVIIAHMLVVFVSSALICMGNLEDEDLW